MNGLLFWLLMAASCAVSGVIGWQIRTLVDAHRETDRYDAPEEVDG